MLLGDVDSGAEADDDGGIDLDGLLGEVADTEGVLEKVGEI